MKPVEFSGSEAGDFRRGAIRSLAMSALVSLVPGGIPKGDCCELHGSEEV